MPISLMKRTKLFLVFLFATSLCSGQTGGMNKTANVHGLSYWSIGAELGVMGNVPGINVRYHRNELLSASAGGGFYGLGWSPYGRLGYTYKRDQNFRKGKRNKRGFTRYYSQVWIGYREFVETDWFDFDVEQAPTGGMVQAGLSWEWKQVKKSRRLSVGIGAMLDSDNNYLPFYPEISYSFDLPFDLGR